MSKSRSKATSKEVATIQSPDAVVQVGEQVGRVDDNGKWVFGFSLTIVIADQPVVISNEDVAAMAAGKFKFKLNDPVSFPDVKTCYNNLRDTEPFESMNLPKIDWDQGAFKPIGGIRATINTFSIDTEKGYFALSILFKHEVSVLGLKFADTSFTVRRVAEAV